MIHLRFDRGTLTLASESALPDDMPGVLWDARVGVHRASAHRYAELASELARRGLAFTDSVTPFERRHIAARALDLRPYQVAALAAWEGAGRRGISVLPTGSGKTRIALAAMARVEGHTLCLVPTRVLLQQWLSEIRKVYAGPIGVLGDGQRTVGPVTVTTFESALRHMSRIGDRFELLLVDEVHHFGNNQRDEALEMCVAPFRLGLTATPPADVAADALSDLVGPITERLSIADLAGRYLADFELIVVHLPLNPVERRAYDSELAAYRPVYRRFRELSPGGTWQEFMTAAKSTHEGRAALAAWRKARKLLSLTEAKARWAKALLERHRGQRVLIFTSDNNAAYALARQHLIMPITCDIKRREREQALLDFREGRLDALVSARVLNEGIDVPDAEIAIILGGTQGEREHVQRVGRLLRPREGKRAIIYELVTAGSSEARQGVRRRAALSTAPSFPRPVSGIHAPAQATVGAAK